MSELTSNAVPRKPNNLKARNFASTSKILIFAIIFIGVTLRFVQYLLDRSLWIDESFLALNIIGRSYADLLKPLDFNQAAPIGFLIVEKLATQVFGKSEYTLRLFPFLVAILSLFLFYFVARQTLKLSAVPIALGLFAVSDRLIYYSSEVKQYSSDVAVVLVLYLAIISSYVKNPTVIRNTYLAVLGAIVIWISHPAVFVLAGTGISVILLTLFHRQWSKFISYCVVTGIWGLSFIAFYFISLRELSSNEYLSNSWNSKHDAFMPFPPLSFSDIRWFIDTFFDVFNYPLGLYFSGIAALVFIIGCISKFSDNRENFIIIFSPIVLALLASGLHKYPFKGHLLLFLIPTFLIFIAAGVQKVIDLARQQHYLILGILLTVLLLFHPLYNAALNLKNPQGSPHPLQRVREDIKPVLSYVSQHRQAGDVIYLYYAAQYAFKYYAERYGFDNFNQEQADWNAPPESWFEPALPSYPPQLIVGRYARGEWQTFADDLNKVRGNQRVWVIFSHVYDRRSTLDQEDVFLYLLDTIGTKIDSFKSVEASAYLYDLS